MKKTKVAAIISVLLTTMSMAGPGQGIRVGSWVASPYASLIGCHNSNVDRRGDDTRSDYFLDTEAGLKLGYSTFSTDFEGIGFMGHRNYAELSEKDFSSAGEILKFRRGTHDTLQIEAQQSYRKVEDLDQYGSDASVAGVSPDSVLDASSRSGRDISSYGLAVGRNLTDRVQTEVGYRYDQVKYASDELFALQSQIGQIETFYQATDKSDAMVTLKGGAQDNGEVSSPAAYYSARLGLRTRGTEKITFKGGAGVQEFDRSEADALMAFNYDMSVIWAVTEKVNVQCGARNGLLLSSLYKNNGSQYDSFWAGFSYYVQPTTVLSSSIAYRQDCYLDPVETSDGMVDRQDDGVAVRVKADYQTPARFMRLFCQATYEKMDSNVVFDYDETRFELGTTFQY